MVAGNAPVVIIGLVGAGGFEPPNTGSKVPRLTAWPRPRIMKIAELKTAEFLDVAIPQFPDSPVGSLWPPGIDKCSGSTVYGQPARPPAWPGVRVPRV